MSLKGTSCAMLAKLCRKTIALVSRNPNILWTRYSCLLLFGQQPMTPYLYCESITSSQVAHNSIMRTKVF